MQGMACLLKPWSDISKRDKVFDTFVAGFFARAFFLFKWVCQTSTCARKYNVENLASFALKIFRSATTSENIFVKCVTGACVTVVIVAAAAFNDMPRPSPKTLLLLEKIVVFGAAGTIRHPRHWLFGKLKLEVPLTQLYWQNQTKKYCWHKKWKNYEIPGKLFQWHD